MKRTPIQPDPASFPSVFAPLLARAQVYDSSCSPEARVLFLDADKGYYLKIAARGSLKNEADMTRYFFQKGLGTEVVTYLSEEHDYLLSVRMAGEDCTHAVYLERPERLCDLLAMRLRMLHETPYDGCPVANRTDVYLQTVHENYRKGMFDPSYFADYGKAESADAIYDVAMRGGCALQNDTLLHGDYCLPNIMLDDWRFSGFIDLGQGGVGDRHIDLFWGAWTLRYNLGTDRYRERFFDAYGRDLIDPERLFIVAACETFG